MVHQGAFVIRRAVRNGLVVHQHGGPLRGRARSGYYGFFILLAGRLNRGGKRLAGYFVIALQLRHAPHFQRKHNPRIALRALSKVFFGIHPFARAQRLQRGLLHALRIMAIGAATAQNNSRQNSQNRTLPAAAPKARDDSAKNHIFLTPL